MANRILYVIYASPANYPPLEHSGLILLKAGWRVRFFGIESEGESRKLDFPEPLAGCVNLWNYQAPGLGQKAHYFAFVLKAWSLVLWQSPDWVYCSDLMSCPVALLIHYLTRSRVVYHEHDSPTEKGQSDSTFQRFLLWCRKRVGQKADLVVLPNEMRLELFERSTGRNKKSLCVFNCPREDEVMPEKSGTRAKNMLRLAYHGTLNGRLPLAVLKAMSKFPGRILLSVAGYESLGSKGYMANYLHEAELLGLGQTVEFVGALPRHKVFELASRCDVGLAFMPLKGGDVNMVNMPGASNKAFDYLACGLALLVSDLPDWNTMFVEPGYGLACDPEDADSIASQLRGFLERPEETQQMGERGRQRILADWNYENQFNEIYKVLKTSNE